MPPRVSIIIPAYNADRWLAETVESVRNQTIRDWELLIVNDGSTDQTSEIATILAGKDSRIRLVTQEQLGVSAARNAGVMASSRETPYVAFLDADDLWAEDALSILITSLDARPEAVGAHGLGSYIDADGAPINIGRLERWGRLRPYVVGVTHKVCTPDENTGFKSLALGGYMPIGTQIVRRTQLEAEELFDESLRACEDWDLWVRLSLKAEFLFVDRVILKYRRHAQSTTSDRKLVLAGHYDAATRLLESGKMNMEQRSHFIASRPFSVLMRWSLRNLVRGNVVNSFAFLVIAIRNLICFSITPVFSSKARSALVRL